MNDNKFFDMDLDEPIVQEGSVRDPLMFYDDDEVVQEADEDIELDTAETAEEPAVDEPTEDAPATEETEPLDYEKKYLDDIKKREDLDLIEQLEIAVGAKLPKDFAEGVFAFDKPFIYSDSKIEKDGKVIFVVNEMFTIRRMISNRNDDNCGIEDKSLFAIGDDGFGNFIVMKTTDNTYHIWYHDTKNTVMIAKAFNEEGVDPGYDITEKDTLIYLLKQGSKNSTDEESSTEEVPEEVESTDDIAVEEEPDGSTEVTEDIETTEEPAVEEEPADETPAETEEPSTEDEPTLESFVQEAFDMKSEAAKMIQRPEVRQAIADSIDKQFKEICGSWVNPTEAELKENRERVWNQIKDRPEIALSLHAKKYFDELLDAQTKAMRDDSMAKLEEMKKKIMERREKNVNESFVQEDGEVSDEQTVGEAIEAENETPDTGSTTTSDDFDFSLDLDLSSSDDALEGSTTPEGDDLKDFGTDTSDVQNDYDPKEIEILNKLIAAEAEAINDYFDASKDSHDSNARRLYSDIGREERFHMEQLMYQKSAFTGEKYEPRDPEVKKEFEELLQLGMDDHTAMQTAIDKRSMETSTDSVDEMDFEILEYAANDSLTMLHQAEIILEASMYAYYHRADNTAKQYGIILEAYFQEEVVNTARAPKELKGTPNPFALLLKAFKAALKGLSSLTANIRESSERSRINRHARLEWIKKNGITGLFKSGKYFYFYNDTDAAFNMVIPVQYVDLLYRLSVDIGKKCGVTVTEQGYHGTIKNPIKYGSIEDGMAKIRSLNMTKTKVIVTDKNKDALINEFFGYSDKKINVKVWNEEANRAIYESNNVYNKLMCFAVITAKYSQVTDQILEVMQGLQGNMNSIYYKDRNAYNKYVGYMETIVKTYMSITKAATSDLTEMLSLDKEGVKDVTASRDAGNKLPEGAEDRRTSGALGNNRANKQYAKTKK